MLNEENQFDENDKPKKRQKPSEWIEVEIDADLLEKVKNHFDESISEEEILNQIGLDYLKRRAPHLYHFFDKSSDN